MKKLLMAVAIAAPLALSVSAVVPSDVALAAPITCKGNQTATNDNGTFSCVNNGGQDTGSVRPKGGNTNFSKPPQ